MDIQAWTAILGVSIAFAGLLITVANAFGRKIERLETERKASSSELHRRVDEVRDSQATFARHVPETYATIAYLKDVEARMSGNLTAVETRITASLGAAEARLTDHFKRIEDRLDVRRTAAGE
jgi:hypothetical protein